LQQEEETLPSWNEDLNKIVKKVDVYHQGMPHHRETPYFNHEMYYNELESAYRDRNHKGPKVLGNTMLYGEVVTSTSTMLDKNYSILKNLPHGMIAVGTTQIAGRGRANNVWVNPPGVLAVSGVLRLPISEFSGDSQTASPIIFVQYLVALAMVEAIKSYGPGYADMPVRLKWPNDVYAAAPGTDGTQQKDYVKVGGIIVNSNIFDGEYVLVFGCGVNVSNPAPTTSLNHVLESFNQQRARAGLQKLPEIRLEILLARFLSRMDEMLWDFKWQGFSAFEALYYKHWMHSGAHVTLEQYGNTKAVIRGITLDYGLLVVEEVDREGQPLGRRLELQPDGNSFDMFKGLLKKKT
jgi:biotin--protein ligase